MTLKKIHTICMAVLGMIASACQTEKEAVRPDADEPSIDFSIEYTEQAPSTRALINTLSNLQDACKPTSLSGGKGHYIWLWGSYKAGGNLEQIETIFYKRKLRYDLVENDYATQWNYEGQKESWRTGATYVFRALYSDHLEQLEIRGNDATKLQVKYSTQLLQDDLLAASAAKSNPVILNFKHVLAALRFQFRFKPQYIDGIKQTDGIANQEDSITECWIENAASDLDLNNKVGCFATVGSMHYGQGTIGGSVADRETLFWQSNLCEKTMYHWTSDPSNTYNKFENKTSGTTTTVTAATAYRGTSSAGGLFTQNDGWILAIPNYITKPLKLCFKSKMNGENVYSVLLNKLTDVPPSADNSNFEYEGHYYEPLVLKHNMRYTFSVIFRATDLDVEVDIKPWRNIDISDEIIY